LEKREIHKLRVLHSGKLWPYSQTLDCRENPSRNPHSSLLGVSISYDDNEGLWIYTAPELPSRVGKTWPETAYLTSTLVTTLWQYL